MTVLQQGEPQVIPITPNDEPYDTILRTAAFLPEGVSPEPESLGQVEVHHLKFEGKRKTRPGLLLKHFKPYFGRWSLKYYDFTQHVTYDYDPLLEMQRERYQHQKVLRNPPYSRQEIVLGAAAVLARLRQGLGQLGLSPARAQQILLGNPVGFRGFSRNRLLQACLWSGLVASPREALQKIRFVYEPVAVACGAVQAGRSSERVLVFDFGGGTLDLAVVRFAPQGGLLHPEAIEAVHGLPMAGHHIDWAMVQYLLERDAGIRREYEVRSARDGRSADQELLEYVEAVKKDLSSCESASYPYGQNPLRLTRAELESLLQPLLVRVAEAVAGVIQSLPPDHRHIHRVVTAGGSSLIPAVQRTLWTCFDHQREQPRFQFFSASSEHKRGGPVEKALLGVARGLSLYGRRQDVRERTDRALYVLTSSDTFVEVMPGGAPYRQGWAAGPVQALALPKGPGGGVTLAVYEEGPLGKEYLVQYLDVPAGSGLPLCQCHWEKGALLPVFEVGGVRFDPLQLDDDQLQQLLADDESRLSFGGPCSPPLPCLRLGLGDQIVVASDPSLSGTVLEIRHSDSWQAVTEATPDLSSYQLRTGSERSRSSRFTLNASQCRVAERGGRYQDSLKDNLFTEQLRQVLQHGD